MFTDILAGTNSGRALSSLLRMGFTVSSPLGSLKLWKFKKDASFAFRLKIVLIL